MRFLQGTGINLVKNGVHWQTRATTKSRETPMNPQELFCPNMDCAARGQVGKGNIHTHSLKGKRCICDVCEQIFTTTTGTIFYRLRSDPQLVMWVIVLVAYGCSIQAILKAFGLDERTVCDWYRRAGRIVKINDADVQVFEYKSADAMETKYLIRDRDRKYASHFSAVAASSVIQELKTPY
jgi:transposase-like protein